MRNSPGRKRAYSWCLRFGHILARFPAAGAAHAEAAPYSQCSTLTVCKAAPQSRVPASLAEELRRAVVDLLLASEALSWCEDALSCSCPAGTVCLCMSATSRALSCASFTSTPAASTPPALLLLLAPGAVDSAGSGLLLPVAPLAPSLLPPSNSSAEDTPAVWRDRLCAAGAGGPGEVVMGCRQASRRRAARAGRPGRRASNASPATTSLSAHANAPMSSAMSASLGSSFPSTVCPRCQNLHHARQPFLPRLDRDTACDSKLRTFHGLRVLQSMWETICRIEKLDTACCPSK